MHRREDTKIRRVRTGAVLLVAGLTLAAPWGPAAASAQEPAGARRAERAALRARVTDGLDRRVEDGAAPAHAAALGDIVTIADPADASHPKGDIREVRVSDGGGFLLFTMQVEQYSDPNTDPAWVEGATGALWFLDTSGDAEPEVAIDLYNTGTGMVAEVFDAHSGVFICADAASTNAVDKTYTARIASPGCLGDVKAPAVGGVFVLDDAVIGDVFDFAPNDGNLVRFNRPPPGQPAGGYAIVTRSAGFQRFGAVPPAGATQSGTFENYIGPRPVVGAAGAREFAPALWSVTDDGEVSTQDDAEYYDDASALPLAQPVVGMAVLPDRSGYWLVASDGGIFSYGDAAFYGSTGGIRLTQPIVGMAATPTGEGYWLVASDGGIFAYGDASFYGSTGNVALVKPVVGMAAGHQGQGYWLVAADGGIFSFGLPFYGSTGAIALQQPIVGMSATRSGGGYRFIARDGGLFSFGDAEFHGSAASPGRTDVVAVATA